MKYLLSIFAVVALIAGCSASRNFTDAGEKLYYDKCGGCHRIYEKSEFTKERWEDEVEDMSRRAKLTPEEKNLIKNYLFENSGN